MRRGHLAAVTVAVIAPGIDNGRAVAVVRSVAEALHPVCGDVSGAERAQPVFLRESRMGVWNVQPSSPWMESFEIVNECERSQGEWEYEVVFGFASVSRASGLGGNHS